MEHQGFGRWRVGQFETYDTITYLSTMYLNIKNMKRIILPLAALALIAASCDKKMEVPQQENITEVQEVLQAVTLKINGCQTKATSVNANEEKIKSLNVFIYRKGSDGIEKYDSFYSFDDISAENKVYIDPNNGAVSYRIAVYANQDLVPAENGSVLNDQALFSNESADKFQMYGYSESSAADLIHNKSVSINLIRQCSRVCVKEIAVDWTNSANNLKSFKLKGIYLMDVPSVLQNYSPLAADALKTQTEWYNTLGHNSSSQDALLYDSINNQSVTESSSYKTPHYLYGYISLLDDYYTTNSWKPSGTRLVIEAEFDGQPCYYAILLSDLVAGEETGSYVRNKAFTFNKITITKPGAKEPYSELQTELALSFSVSVLAWDEIREDTYTIE